MEKVCKKTADLLHLYALPGHSDAVPVAKVCAISADLLHPGCHRMNGKPPTSIPWQSDLNWQENNLSSHGMGPRRQAWERWSEAKGLRSTLPANKKRNE